MAQNLESEGQKLPDVEALRTLIRGIEDVDEQAGDLRDARKDIWDDAKERGVHKEAFNMCHKLLKLDEDERATLLAHFDYYRENLGVDPAQNEAFDADEMSNVAA